MPARHLRDRNVEAQLCIRIPLRRSGLPGHVPVPAAIAYTGDPVECQPVSAHGMDSGVILDAGWGGLRRRSSLLCVAELASMVSSFLFPAGLCDLCHSRPVREARTSF